MFERFTRDARTVVVHAQEHARRLGHRYIGCEHILLALAGSGQPAGAVLREQGVTPERVETEIVHLVGLGAGAGLFEGLDRDALAAIGVDLDAVRARIEAAFGMEALTQASQALQQTSRRPRRARLLRRWHRRRIARRMPPAPAAPEPAAVPPATGRYQAPGGRPTGHIPFTPAAKKTLEYTLREAVARHDGYLGVEHIALGLLSLSTGVVPPILSALSTSAPRLRAAIEDRYRQAS